MGPSRFAAVGSPSLATAAGVALGAAVAFAVLPATSAQRHPTPAVPPAPGSFDDLPGNHACVSCNVVAAVAVASVELWLLSAFTAFLAPLLAAPKPKVDRTHPHTHSADDTSADNAAPTGRASPCAGPSPVQLAWIVSIFGWGYWFLIFVSYWNFLSYMLTILPMLVLPSMIASYNAAPSTSKTRTPLLWTRICLAGWLAAILMMVLFPNVGLLPEQLSRHFDKSRATIVPDDPLVLQLRERFYFEAVDKETYDQLPFVERMAAVDEFIYETITWKEDMAQYQVVGLLTSPHDVLTRMAGDCQGQSAVTASLIFALGGVQAWCTETPFHWWTHARDDATGETYNLNAHGNAGLDGSVTPQPVGMMYTWFADRCDLEGGAPNCTQTTARNRETITYLADPMRAFSIAMTGTHEFRRDLMPNFDGGKQYLLVVIGAAVAVVCGLYATYFQCDFCALLKGGDGFTRFCKRCIIGLAPSVVGMVCMYVWAYLFYPVLLVQLIATITYALTYACSDSFNVLIGTPTPVPPSMSGSSCVANRAASRSCLRRSSPSRDVSRSANYSAVPTTGGDAYGIDRFGFSHQAAGVHAIPVAHSVEMGSRGSDATPRAGSASAVALY